MWNVLLPLAVLVCQVNAEPDESPPGPSPVQDATFHPAPEWKPLGKDLWFDPEAKRLILEARVCLREGYLEHLLCAKNSKEHESILSTEAPARLIHAGLLLTGAEVGRPVQFVPDFHPPQGTPIAIEARWTDREGNPQSIDARQWVREEETNQTLVPHWVFAGSSLYPHPTTGEMIYAAESGDLITVANFMSAILDVPFASTADDTARSYMAFTDRIPPLGTPVFLVLAPAARGADNAAKPATPSPPADSVKEPEADESASSTGNACGEDPTTPHTP